MASLYVSVTYNEVLKDSIRCTVRFNNVKVADALVPLKTALYPCIPAGTYDAVLFDSPKFDSRLIYLHVPNRTGIEFHTGNWVVHNNHTYSRGCFIVGDFVRTASGTGKVVNSKYTLRRMQCTYLKDLWSEIVVDVIDLT